MKKRLSFMLLPIIIISMIQLAVHAYASGASDTQDPSKMTPDGFANNIEMVLLNEETKKTSIACFDVNQDGMIALGFDSSPKKTVYIYDQTGRFQYGYEFYCSGCFAITFEDENLVVYFSRGQYVAVFDQYARCLSVTKVTNSQMTSLLYVSEKVTDSAHYQLERDIGWHKRAYSRLVVIDSDGARHILFDVSFVHNTKVIVQSIVTVLFVGMVARRAIKHYLARRFLLNGKRSIV